MDFSTAENCERVYLLYDWEEDFELGVVSLSAVLEFWYSRKDRFGGNCRILERDELWGRTS